MSKKYKIDLINVYTKWLSQYRDNLKDIRLEISNVSVNSPMLPQLQSLWSQKKNQIQILKNEIKKLGAFDAE